LWELERREGAKKKLAEASFENWACLEQGDLPPGIDVVGVLRTGLATEGVETVFSGAPSNRAAARKGLVIVEGIHEFVVVVTIEHDEEVTVVCGVARDLTPGIEELNGSIVLVVEAAIGAIRRRSFGVLALVIANFLRVVFFVVTHQHVHEECLGLGPGRVVGLRHIGKGIVVVVEGLDGLHQVRAVAEGVDLFGFVDGHRACAEPMAARTAMMAITTSSSIKVKPRFEEREEE
jgi:hypothetical protein